MTWEELLKAKRIPKRTRDIIDEIMSDGVKRTAAEVSDQLYDLNQEDDRRHTTMLVATPREVIGYLSRNKKYSSIKDGVNYYYLKGAGE